MTSEVQGRLANGDVVRVAVSSDGYIAAIEPAASVTGTQLWLAPGLVDLQVNGYRGDDFNGLLDVATVGRIVRNLMRVGTTRFLPTLITAGKETLLRNLAVIAEARTVDPLCAAAIPGVHMEGPWISPQDGYRGAHPLDHVRRPSLDEFEEWQKASGGLIKLVTLSPHWDGVCDAIEWLAARGVAVSLGHTHASGDQVRAAAKAGASLSTHLGNGLPAFLPRHPNPIWSQLAEDRLAAMFIADGHHVPAETLLAMLRAKGLRQCLLTSDLVALAGMAPGTYTTPVGGDVELGADGCLRVKGTGLLAGATATLADNVTRCIAMTGISLEDALWMATEGPAQQIEISHGLVIGAVADFFQFRWNSGSDKLDVVDVWVHGVRQDLGGSTGL